MTLYSAYKGMTGPMVVTLDADIQELIILLIGKSKRTEYAKYSTVTRDGFRKLTGSRPTYTAIIPKEVTVTFDPGEIIQLEIQPIFSDDDQPIEVVDIGLGKETIIKKYDKHE